MNNQHHRSIVGTAGFHATKLESAHKRKALELICLLGTERDVPMLGGWREYDCDTERLGILGQALLGSYMNDVSYRTIHQDDH